jgi:chondroitin AC lyase
MPPLPWLAAVSALLVLASSRSVVGDDMAVVRDRARHAFGWTTADISTTVTAAKGFAKALNATCYWPDIDYFSTDRANWLTEAHLDRVQTMVQALTKPGSPAFEDAGISTAAHCALGVWLDRHFTNSNWWYQCIGTEILLQSTFLMLGTNRTSPSEQALLTKYSFDSSWWVNPYGGGANLVWMIQVEIMRGAATGNATALQQAFSVMWADVRMGSVSENWQGIVADQSYHFHGQQILSAAYGMAWLQLQLQFWPIASGTVWAMPDANVAILAAFIAEGDAQLTFGAGWDYGVNGRGLSRPSNFEWSLPTSVIRALAQETGAEPWAAELVTFSDILDGLPSATHSSSSKHFYASDFFTHHRPTWGATVKMHGTNGVYAVVGNECDNSENLLGEHTGDGVLNVFHSTEKDVTEQDYEGIFPLLDWNQINGITVEHDKPIEPCTMGTGDVWAVRNTLFVGGASDGLFGLAAMDTATHNTTVQRSWFFFDDAIVSLASNLSNSYGHVTSPGDVWTTLASRNLPAAAADPLRGPVTVGYPNGSASVLPDGNATFASASDVAWFNAGGITFIPSLPVAGVASSAPTLGIFSGTKTGNWNTIGQFPSPVSGRVLTAWLEHGSVLPAGPGALTTGYAYLIAPNTTAAEAPALAAKQAGTACVFASGSVHGAAQPSAGLASAVFWAAEGGVFSCTDASTGWTLSVTSSSAGMLLVRETAGSVTVTIAHPYVRSALVNITLTRIATGTACSPGAAAGTTVVSLALPVAADLLGSSVSATCAL